MIPPSFRRLFRNPFARQALSREVDDEFAFHLEESARAREAAGLDPQTARREALAQFGSIRRWHRQSLRERSRAQAKWRRVSVLREVMDDLRGATGRLRRRPAFAFIVVAVLAAGVGSFTAISAVVDATMLRPMPFKDPERVVRIFGVSPRYDRHILSPANYLDLKAGMSSVTAMSTTVPTVVTVFAGGPQRRSALLVEADFFDVIGVEPSLGRRIIAQDEAPGSGRVAVLAHDLWASYLSSDPDIVGSTLRIDSDEVTVVGVMPEIFAWPSRNTPDLFLSDPFRGDRTSRGQFGPHWPIGRLAPGVSRATAEAQAKAIMARLAEALPETNGPPGSDTELSVRLEAFRDQLLFPTQRATLLIMAGAAVLILLAVGGNTSGLLLARTAARHRELNIRAALGAERGRLVREVLTDTGILTALGMLTGIVLSYGLLDAVRRLAPQVALLDTAAIDGRTVAGCTGMAVLLWLASGILPALIGSQAAPGSALKEAAGTPAPRLTRTRKALIVFQLGVTCTLLSAAGVLVDGYMHLVFTDPGFDATDTAVLQVTLPATRYTENDSQRVRIRPEARDFTARVLERLSQVPGVRSVTAASYPPYQSSGSGGSYGPDLEDDAIPPPERRFHRTKWVSPNYFETLGIPLLQGRTFGASDNEFAEAVVVVNQALADWMASDHAIVVGSTSRLYQVGPMAPIDVRVVGVVGNTLHTGPQFPDEAIAYLPFAQQQQAWDRGAVSAALARSFIVRLDGEADPPLGDLQAALWTIDPEVPLTYARTLESMRGDSLRTARLLVFLFGAFGALAILLSMTATFALLAQLVHSRAREIGVRRVLGAPLRDTIGRVLGEGLRLVLGGLALGVIGAYVLDGWVVRQTEAVAPALDAAGVEGWSLMAQLASVLLLLTIGLGAAVLPALAASRVDPVESLKSE